MPCAFLMYRPKPYHEYPPGCQFDEVDEDLITVGGQTWCNYHCPMVDQAGQPTEKATWDWGRLKKFEEVLKQRCDDACSEKHLLDWTGLIVPAHISFEGWEFPSVYFLGATFCKSVLFMNANFSGEAVFTQATFKGQAWFPNATFGKTEFCDTTFSSQTYFQGVTFKGQAWFIRTTFSDTTLFHKATFSEAAVFKEATFSGVTLFENTTFRSDANFANATFSEKVVFRASGESQEEESVKANLMPSADFTGAIFGAEVTFENRQFLRAVSFADCTFERAPKFHSCHLPQGTTFPSREYFKDVTSRGAAQAYCTLKMATQQERERGKFYALEQLAWRHRAETRLFEKVILFLYEWTADFGESPTRPLLWLLIVTEFFVFLYASTMTLYFPFGKMGYDVASFHMAIEQVGRPFSGWTPSSGTMMKMIFENKGLPFFLKLLSTTQSLLNVSFFALFIFAVRRKFKMG